MCLETIRDLPRPVRLVADRSSHQLVGDLARPRSHAQSLESYSLVHLEDFLAAKAYDLKAAAGGDISPRTVHQRRDNSTCPSRWIDRQQAHLVESLIEAQWQIVASEIPVDGKTCRSRWCDRNEPGNLTLHLRGEINIDGVERILEAPRVVALVLSELL